MNGSKEDDLQVVLFREDGVSNTNEEYRDHISVSNSYKRQCRELEKARKLSKESIEEVFRSHCCNLSCTKLLKRFGIRLAREKWYRQNEREHAFTLQQMVTFQPKKNYFTYKIDGRSVCLSAFKSILGISYSRIQKCKQNMQSDPTPRKRLGRTETSNVYNLRSWLSTFFAKHCDIQPDKDRRHLPSKFTKLEIFKIFSTSESTLIENAQCSFSQFVKIWRKYFPTVLIPASNRFGACSQCEFFKAKIEKSILQQDKGNIMVLHKRIILCIYYKFYCKYNLL
jgi:hypothetical protein